VNPNALDLAVGSPPGNYTLVLESQPAAAVTVRLATDSKVTVDPEQIVFNADNWNRPQTVTVTIAMSQEVAISQQSTIHHSATSPDSDYNNIGVPNLVVHITDEGAGIFLPVITRE
jgi:hypothetical protein